MEFMQQTIDNTAATILFGVIVLGILGALMLLALITSALIRYSVRRIRRWFVENVILRKVEAEQKSFRRV